jgi:hypothetical protein
LRRGAIYSRTDAAACEEASPEDVDRILSRALETRLGSFQRMASTMGEAAAAAPVRTEGVASEAPFTHEALRADTTLRAADLFPVGLIQPPLRIRELETLVERSRVRGGGSAFFPRYMDRLAAPYVIVLRHPDRLVLTAESDADGTEPHMAIVASMTRDGTVRVRETLWEDFHGPIAQQGGSRLGLATTIAFAIATLLFAYRYYGSVGVERFRVRVGLVAPNGRMLFMDSDRRYPLLQAYRATTTEDLFVERALAVDDVNALEKRKEVAFSLSSELYEYFGFELTRELFDGLLGEVRYVEMDGEPPTLLRPPAAGAD